MDEAMSVSVADMVISDLTTRLMLTNILESKFLTETSSSRKTSGLRLSATCH